VSDEYLCALVFFSPLAKLSGQARELQRTSMSICLGVPVPHCRFLKAPVTELNNFLVNPDYGARGVWADFIFNDWLTV
jgi:hypothetical protein